ncbi:hypothetical protein TNCT_102391 [Trichonephila clavata]|uniref:Peptidase aspartic putative domain-containing protein n=1 Tax=Trichonephila clavata TaxID=2740835 RepID=A0A8X6KJK0_TRICU|nr:hypothetical protein TNCT_102391 [Trichonephila clavata]
MTPCETFQSLKHNSLFRPKTKIKTPLQNNKTEIPEVDNVKKPETETLVKDKVMSSVLNPQYSPKNSATLLQTAEVQVINGCKRMIATLLFDSGYQKSFIRNDLKNALNLKPISKKRCVNLYLFQSKASRENIRGCKSNFKEQISPLSIHKHRGSSDRRNNGA